MTAECNLLQESGGTPHRKLTSEAISRAAELVRIGAPMASVAQGIGVHRSTLWEWIRAGTEPGATGLEADLADAITRARVEGEETLLQRLHQLAEKGDTRAATWLLSHSPRWRDTWSDAAQARREVQRTVQLFVAALEEEPSLQPEQREKILLRARSKGLALAAEDCGEADLEAAPHGGPGDRATGAG